MNTEEVENAKDDLRQLYKLLGKKPSLSKRAIKIILKYIEEIENNNYEANNIINNYIDARRETKERMELLEKEMLKHGCMTWAGKVHEIYEQM